MNSATPRTKKMLAAGAVLLVFGITVPATASSEAPGQPDSGSVGMARVKANPKGQTENDRNRGFTCDENPGVGAGNPALAPTCDGSTAGPDTGGAGSGGEKGSYDGPTG